ncbi:hypothetical protein ACHAWO_001275 [Cyclotella atomus]|uniref:Anaphase-promoting complex subunit 6 n=1 Tax=Cyclotella atomus TaxID=382360 RepID=A0ABD3NH16_9STRA
MVLSGSGRSPPPPTNRRIRLSYGTAANNSHATQPPTAAGATPATNETEDTHDDGRNSSSFLAALSPATAKYLKSDAILNSRSVDIDQKQEESSGNEETKHLRAFVRSLLGISSSDRHDVLMQTPDPQTATFYATQLYSLTNRIDDAYLAARAMMLNNEEKRAVWLLEGAGLLGARVEGDAAAGNDESDNGVTNMAEVTNNNVSSADGIRAAIQLRTESSLLAGQCLTKIGEIERALTVYSEAMRFPPVPPRREWGAYGFGCRLSDSGDNTLADDNAAGEDEDGPNESYMRQWREQSLSNSALIDEGDDSRLLRLAENVCPLPFGDDNGNSGLNAMTGIHPVARLCTARGIAYDSLSNAHRALPFLRVALQIDPRCIEAWDYVIKRKLLTPAEEREWYDMLNWKDISLRGMAWLKDAYLVRLRGGGMLLKSPSAVETIREHDNMHAESHIMDASSVHYGVGLQTPSAFSLGSPDFGKGHGDDAPVISEESDYSVDQAFRNLAITHHLGKSSDVLALAAIRSYASHNLQAALTYCTVIDTLDPFCRTAGYVYVATLVGLGLKRRLFQLAHRLVDANPEDSLAWFAVGSYYHVCGRHDLSQRHFSRSTRLDPSSAECWIGFGCSFAICDESDQALASFRAAQNKYSGSHIPLLYMGMEYLRTNHLSLAGHFLASSQKTDPSDPLCCNELGVWAFRRGDLGDAKFWFVKALRLHVQAQSSSLTCADEALGANGYILLNNKVNEEALNNTGGAVKSAETPLAKPSKADPPLPSTVLCAVKTPSGQPIAAHKLSNLYEDSNLTDLDCVDRCKDVFWEPTIYNLGQSYRKLQQYENAIVCFQKCSSLNPVSSTPYINVTGILLSHPDFSLNPLQGSAAASSALGFARHLAGDIDGAIDSYHEALSRKPDDQFSTEMLNRALAEAITYPKSSVFDSDMFAKEVLRQTSVIGRSLLPPREMEVTTLK